VAAEAAKAALASECGRRGLKLPIVFDVPDRAAWTRGYVTAARDVPGLAEKDVEAALTTAKSLVDPLLNGSAEGIWDPGRSAWH
jgi:hypothetical protein